MLLEPYVSDRQCEDCLEVYPQTEFRFDNKAREHVKVCRCCAVDRAAAIKAKMTKQCTCCQQELPKSDFSKTPSGVQSRCKECRRKIQSGHEQRQRTPSPTAWKLPTMTTPESIACQQFAAWRGKTTPGLIGPSIHARIAA